MYSVSAVLKLDMYLSICVSFLFSLSFFLSFFFGGGGGGGGAAVQAI